MKLLNLNLHTLLVFLMINLTTHGGKTDLFLQSMEDQVFFLPLKKKKVTGQSLHSSFTTNYQQIPALGIKN